LTLDLFETMPEKGMRHHKKSTPLYSKMRPSNLDDFLGQKSISPFLELIKKDSIPSLILWGPPGCGKTTLACIIKNITKKDFVHLSAVLSGIKELRETVQRAKNNLTFRNRQTILFIDEIHRFNKAQQDALLPHIEDGTFILIGATTENPGFEVIPALISRCEVLTFNPLSEEDIVTIIERIIEKGNYSEKISKDGIKKISSLSNGDARFAINLLETCINNLSDRLITEKDISSLNTIRAEIFTTTTSLLSLKVSGEAIRTQRYIISPACLNPAKTRNLLQDA